MHQGGGGAQYEYIYVYICAAMGSVVYRGTAGRGAYFYDKCVPKVRLLTSLVSRTKPLQKSYSYMAGFFFINRKKCGSGGR